MSAESATTDQSLEIRAHSELSELNLVADTDVAVLTFLANKAEETGWVKSSFAEALLARERNYPTGLPTTIAVAIPHADVEHVNRAGLGIALLANPVPFMEMGGAGTAVSVQAVVLILVTDPHSQITMLTRLIDVFQTEGWYEKLGSAADSTALADAFNALLEVSERAAES